MADINKIKGELSEDAWKAVKKALPHYTKDNIWEDKEALVMNKHYLDAYKEFIKATDSRYVEGGFNLFDSMCLIKKRDEKRLKSVIDKEPIHDYITKKVKSIYEY